MLFDLFVLYCGSSCSVNSVVWPLVCCICIVAWWFCVVLICYGWFVVWGLIVGCCVALVIAVGWFLIALLDVLSFWFLVWVWLLLVSCLLFNGALALWWFVADLNF